MWASSRGARISWTVRTTTATSKSLAAARSKPFRCRSELARCLSRRPKPDMLHSHRPCDRLSLGVDRPRCRLSRVRPERARPCPPEPRPLDGRQRIAGQRAHAHADGSRRPADPGLGPHGRHDRRRRARPSPRLLPATARRAGQGRPARSRVSRPSRARRCTRPRFRESFHAASDVTVTVRR